MHLAPIAAIVLSIVLLLGRFQSGLVYLTEEPGSIWYLDRASMKQATYGGEGPYLEAMLYAYQVDSGYAYVRKDLWHIDWENRRYKKSLTASYTCGGSELGT